MTTEVRERVENRISAVTPSQRKYRSWMHCPRCIGGNMYLDNTGETCCIQCGYSYFPGKQPAAKME
jgi:uncharacterized protein (DUF983 family)